MAFLGLLGLDPFGTRRSDDISGIDFVITSLGLVLFAGGLFGLVALVAKNGWFRPTDDEMIWWKTKRTQGRKYFIKEFMTTTTLIGGGFLSVLIIYNFYDSESFVVPILGCLTIWITLTLTSYAVANRIWTFYESEFKSNERC